MGKLTGVLVLMVGVLVLVYAMPSRDGEFSVGQTSRLDLPPAPESVVTGSTATAVRPEPQSNGPRTFSPQSPLMGQTARLDTTTELKVTSTVAPAADASTVRRVLSPRPTDEDAKRDLVVNLQKELKRVGCFDGELSGNWGSSARKAMSSFIDRVNATLPVDEPDYILLTLLQGHAGKACGRDCPSGQSAGGDGRCVPNSILSVQAARRSTAQEAKVRVPSRPAVERQVATVAPSDSSWSTRIIPAQPDAPQSRIERAPTVAAVPVAPLPGRMTIGAARPGGLAEVLPSAAVADPVLISGPRTAREAIGATDDPAFQKPIRSAAVARPADEAQQEQAQPAPRKEVRQSEPETRRAAVRRGETRAPVYVYRAPRYFAPPPVYRAPPRPAYTAAQRNWRHAIFSDVTRMR